MGRVHSPLTKQKVFFFDCQTTGMSPANGNLLELGWALGSGATYPTDAQSVVLRQPDDRKIPRRIREITGITDAECIAGALPGDAWREMSHQLPKKCIWVIHYAKFELGFLRPLFGKNEPEIFCTYEIARRLLPGLGSHTLRAVCGHLGRPISPLKRARDHVEATAYVWTKMLELLHKDHNVRSLPDLRRWFKETPPLKLGTRRRAKTYLVESETRLQLVDAPGTYHLKDCHGNILYVGKATSLKSRVNSYFRGQQTKGSRLNELLAQVADIKVHPTATPLEAALLENDQIKEWDPPYNRALKAEAREVFYCDTDFSVREVAANPRYGPFTTSAWWAHWVAMLEAADKPEVFAALLEGESGAEVDPALVLEGLKLLEAEHGVAFRRDPELIRYWLSKGFLYRMASLRARRLEKQLARESAEAEEDEEAETEPEVPEWDAPRVARRLLRFSGHTAFRVHAGRWTRRFHECVLYYREANQKEYRELRFQEGTLTGAKSVKNPPLRKLAMARNLNVSSFKPELNIVTMDRLRVLKTELLRVLARGGDAVLVSPGTRPVTAPQLKQYLFPGQFDG